MAAGAVLGLTAGLFTPVGAQETDPRVVNGTPVDKPTYDAEWSSTVWYFIDLGGGQGTACGGSLITDEVVLTAAHCLDVDGLTTPDQITVIGGTNDLADTVNRYLLDVSEFEIHPGWNPDTFQDDVALLRLASLTPASPVVLALPGDIPKDGTLEFAGWGCDQVDTTPDPGDPQPCEPGHENPSVMREASGPAQPVSVCNDFFAADIDPGKQMCVGNVNEAGTDPSTCWGDSGGPLVARDATGTRLLGITSFGGLCGYSPSGYTAVGGYRDYIDGVADGWDPGGLAPPPAPEEGTFVPLLPARVVDTRSSSPIPARGAREFQVSGVAGVPNTGVTSVALNATATNPAEAGYLTLYPCGGSAPLASNVNYVLGESASNAQSVGLSPDGKLCVATYAQTDVVIDVYGYWQADGQPTPGNRFNAIPPDRLFDTRQTTDTTQLIAGQVTAVSVGHLGSEQVKGAALNLTITEPASDGFLTVFPCGPTTPATSIVNFAQGETVANSVNIGTATDETVCFLSSADTDLVVDATGWFGRPGSALGGRVIPIKNGRLADTRPHGTNNRLAAGSTLTIPVAGQFGVPADAVGVVLNVTAVDTAAPGYLTAFPCGQSLPATSTVNYLADEIVPNLTFTGLDPNGSICVFSYAEADVVVDVQGYVVA